MNVLNTLLYLILAKGREGAMDVMRYRDHRLKFVDHGNGEPIVFLHNGAVSHRLWDYQLAHFEQSHRVVAPDFLGCGDSDRPNIVYAAEDYVEQVEQLVDHLELERFHLVGCCLGGSAALELTRRQPERVKTLSVVTAATPKAIASGLFGPFERVSKPGSRVRNLLAHALETGPGRLVMGRAFYRMQCGRRVLQDASFKDHVRRLYWREGQWRVFCNTSLEGFAHLDAFSKPAGFPPTLIMWGEKNPILKAWAGRELAAVLEPDRMEFWSDCGYMLMRERPSATNAVLAEHFAQAGSAPQSLHSAIELAASPLVVPERAPSRSPTRVGRP
jgi:pimeloyl-ACP methyl ester carboxylesterase